MRKVKRSWMAAMAAVLLLGTLAGVVWARPHDRPQAADITRKVTVSAALFNPSEDGLNWFNDGALSGVGIFIAPVVFPCLSPVTVKKITLSVEDHNDTVDACVTLYRASPKTLMQVPMAEACSTGTWGGAVNYDDTTIEHALVWPAHGPFLLLEIQGTSILVYGVTIEYQRRV